jgi:hypothetical protein
VTYAAPEGIAHYVAAHGYQPPEEFCEALLQSPAVDTAEYFAALCDAGWSTYLAPLYKVGPVATDHHPSVGDALLRIQADVEEAIRGWPGPIDLVMLLRPDRIPAVFWNYDPSYGRLPAVLFFGSDWLLDQPLFDFHAPIVARASAWPAFRLDSVGACSSSNQLCKVARRRSAGAQLPAALPRTANRDFSGEGFVLLATHTKRR